MLRLSYGKSTFVALLSVSFAVLFGLAFSQSVFADDATTDEVSVTIPVSCSITSIADSAHTATVDIGTYEDEIGETTFKVLCNDADGFAIYAAGYSDNIYGNTTMKPSVLDTSNGIATGTATSGNTSNWAMKLAPVSGTYAPTLETGFNAYHAVPSEYTKVASFAASTDAISGSQFKSTYAVYVSQAQPADTYTGKVKYTVVHPTAAPEPVGDQQIGVIFNGNGLAFDQAGTQTTNKVVYEKGCEDEYGYISDTPAVLKTRNLSNDGTKNGPYSQQEGTWYEGDGLNPDNASFGGASKLKVVVTYGLSANSTNSPEFYTDSDSMYYLCGDLCNAEINRSGTETYVLQGSSFYSYVELGSGVVDPDYDYGIYAQVYPIYDEPTEGATYDVVQSVCSYHPVKGTYAETMPWKGHWYMEEDEGHMVNYYDDYDVVNFLNYHQELEGTNITFLAYNPYRIVYNGNGATAGTMDAFATELETNTSEDVINLLAPNYKKTGYGFAGWSDNQNATVNSSDVIHGPNEEMTGNELTFDSNNDLTLYAVWVAPESGVTMQTFNSTAEPYASYDVGTVIALSDTRDDNTYAIAKFADGNWWMMENLRLNPATAVDGSGNSTINSLTTNSPTSTFVDTKLAAILDGTDTAHWKTCQSNNSTCDNQISFGTGNINFNNTASPDAALQNRSWYSYGVLYNYYTATAGNGTYGSSAYDSGSICPINWRIPGNFRNLMVNSLGLEDNTFEAGRVILEYPYNFVYAGRYYGDSASGRNTFTAYMATESGVVGRNAPILSLGRTYGAKWINIETAKWNGYPVRCFAINSQ